MIDPANPLHRFAVIAGLALATVISPVVLSVSSAHAATVKPLSSGLAVGGYDVVAYFNVGKAVKGQQSITSTHDGVSYNFASPSHKAMFDAEPAKYVPAYGGHCALGMRYGQRSPVDPTAWRIKDGKLYMLLNPGTAVIWENKAQKNIHVANEVWSKLR